MKIGFLFPGQGAQTVGMGKDIYENYDIAKAMYDKVKEITKVDIAKISFEGPEETLNRTKYTQLAILTMSLAILEILKEKDVKAEISAGLSLGEYSALIYSGALRLEEGIKLVQKRSEYMEEMVPDGEWQMAAILGLTDEQVEEICKKVKLKFVVPANYNCKGQIAISGEKSGVDEAINLAKEAGAKRAIPLKTSGPFHTSKLIEASEALRRELEFININRFNSKVIKNIDGMLYSNQDDIKDILAKHIVNPVRFSKTIETMLDEGVDTFIEIGPGKTLSGLVKKTNKEVMTLNINNIETLERTMNFLVK